MSEKKFLTKADSKCLYGIAILMMMFHHLFSIPSRINYNYIPIFGAAGEQWEIRIAWICKMCVGIYAFISGYGMCCSVKNGRYMGMYENLKYDFKKVIKHLFQFYKKYWLVFWVFVPVGFVLFGRKFDFAVFIRNLFAVSYEYNGEWWYARQYIGMLLMLPFLDTFINLILSSSKRKKAAAVVCGIVLIAAVVYGLQTNENGVKLVKLLEFLLEYTYIIIFAEGYLISRLNIYERLDACIRSTNTKIFFGVAGTLCVVALRFRLTPYAAWNKADLIFVPVFIFSMALLNHTIGGHLVRGLQYIGNYSTYMWLIHTFFVYHYVQKIVLLPRVSFLIFVWLVVMSLITAMVLDRMYFWITFCVQKYGHRNK